MTGRVAALPTVVLAGWIGTAYLVGDPERTATPSFRAAQTLAPMQWWGLIFLAGAAAMTVTALTRLERALAVAFFIGGAIYSWWGSLFAVSIASDPRASLVAPVLYLFIGFVHFAGAWRIYVRTS